MRECKILKFYHARGEVKQHTNAERIVKNFGAHYSAESMQDKNNRLCDYPMWEKELNSYLQAGWIIHSMSYDSNYQDLIFLLVRQ